MARRRHLGLALAGLILLMNGCQPGCSRCTRTGMTVSAAVVHTTITAPPGGAARDLVRVRGSRFAPNAAITIAFHQYPSASQSDFQRSATTDGAGAFQWDGDLFSLPARDFSTDPNVDVTITAKETASSCFAITTIKAGAILHPPI